MQYQRWFWIRIIQRYIGKIEDVDETWQTAIDKGQLISLHIFPEHQFPKRQQPSLSTTSIMDRQLLRKKFVKKIQ